MAPLRKTEALIPLQDLDLQIHRLRVQRAEKPRLLATYEGKVTRTRSALETLQAEMKALKLDSHKREHAVKECDERIKRLDDQGRLVKKNDEYQALQKEISGIKAERGRVEDGLLDIYMQVDEKAKLEKLRQEEVRQAEAEHDEARRKVEAEIVELDRQIEEQASRRAALTQAADREILRLYERVLEAKDDGVALAAVGKYEVVEDEGRVTYWECQGCSVGLNSQDINILLAGRDVHVCRNCSRILYIRPGEGGSATLPAGGRQASGSPPG